MYRNVRNTLHNDSYFYSPTGQNRIVEWRSKSYEFIYGQVPTFIDWDFNIMLVRDLGQLNREVMEAALVAVLPPID